MVTVKKSPERGSVWSPLAVGLCLARLLDPPMAALTNPVKVVAADVPTIAVEVNPNLLPGTAA